MVQNIRNRLTKAINHQAEKVIYFCNADNISLNQKVHELRRSFKRQRALLSFFRKINNSPLKPVKKEIRNLGRLLSSARESAVNIDLFDKIVIPADMFSERKIKNARELFAEKNRTLLEEVFTENKTADYLNDYFENFIKKLIKGDMVFPVKKQLFKEVARSYSRSMTAYNMLPDELHSEELHNLRKRMKHLGYQLDFIRFLNPRFLKQKNDQLNKITEQLGDDHDLHVFREYLNSDNYGFEKEEIRIIENQIDHQRELNLLKLKNRLKQCFLYTPDEFIHKLKCVD